MLNSDDEDPPPFNGVGHTLFTRARSLERVLGFGNLFLKFEGGNPTFGEGLSEAMKRIHLIFMWSLLSATVGMILRILENSVNRRRNDLGKIILSAIVGLLGAAWSIVSIFVVPAIVFDNVGPFQALKHSVHAIKKTWGESLVRHYGLGLAEFLFILAGLIILIPGILLLFVAWPIGLMICALFVIYIIIIILLFSTADTIFNTALYMYASKGKTPHVYSADTMKNAFKKRE